MKQIRIMSVEDLAPVQRERRYGTEWMAASLANRWLLKLRLAEARSIHGHDSHWVEERQAPKVSFEDG